MKKFISTLLITITLVACYSSMANAELASTNDYYLAKYSSELKKNNPSSKVAIPKVYNSIEMIKSVEVNDETVKNKPVKDLTEGQTNEIEQNVAFSNPEDIFIDKNNIVYIVDKGNNRVVKFDKDGNTLGIYFNMEGEGSSYNTLNNPSGIYVDDEGDMYIADTKNSRIVHLNKDGVFVEEFVKPNAEAIKEYSFNPTKIYISNQGSFYVLLESDFQGFLMVGPNNEYMGSTGSTWVTVSFLDYLISKFGNAAQKASRNVLTAPPYKNFIMDDSGMTYAVTVTVTEDQIVKLNSSGINIYPKGVYGETISAKELRESKKYSSASAEFVDIAVDQYGIIYAVDKNTCNIYLYDQEGNNLAIFGGKGSTRGKFNTPTSMAIDSAGYIYVLDSETNSMQIFEPTKFCTLIKQGTYYYDLGEYGNARGIWNEALELNANYMFAHRSIGKSLIKEKNYIEAMKEYRLADDKKGYSTAFEKQKDVFMKNNFTWLLLVAVAVIVLVIFGFVKFKKYSDKLHLRITTWNGGEEE